MNYVCFFGSDNSFNAIGLHVKTYIFEMAINRLNSHYFQLNISPYQITYYEKAHQSLNKFNKALINPMNYAYFSQRMTFPQ